MVLTVLGSATCLTSSSEHRVVYLAYHLTIYFYLYHVSVYQYTYTTDKGVTTLIERIVDMEPKESEK